MKYIKLFKEAFRNSSDGDSIKKRFSEPILKCLFKEN